MAFNENTRVKIPAILHLCRLGYDYISLSKAEWDENTNIFTDIFLESISHINPDIDQDDIKKEYECTGPLSLHTNLVFSIVC